MYLHANDGPTCPLLAGQSFRFCATIYSSGNPGSQTIIFPRNGYPLPEAHLPDAHCSGCARPTCRSVRIRSRGGEHGWCESFRNEQSRLRLVCALRIETSRESTERLYLRFQSRLSLLSDDVEALDGIRGSLTFPFLFTTLSIVCRHLRSP
jgi:hypothetical protein